MKNRAMSRLCCLLLALILPVTAFAACGDAGDAGLPMLEMGDADMGELYFYGVVKSDGGYYVKVVQQLPADADAEPTDEDFRYVKLAETLDASFQPNGWVGAWSPDQYDSAESFYKADRQGKITCGVRFSYSAVNGEMTVLSEHNHYADLGVDLTTGEPILNPEQIITVLPEDHTGVFYYCGVVRSQGRYYVQALEQYSGAPDRAEYRYLPLCDTLEAYFQPEGYVGGWSPTQYLTAEELAAADMAGQISQGAKFSCFFTDGLADYLFEHDYYAEEPPARPEGVLPDEYDLPVEELPPEIPDVLGLRDRQFGEMPLLRSQAEVTEYALWSFFNGRDGFECYLPRELAVDEGTGHTILSDACSNMTPYFLFSAYTEWDMMTEDRGDEEGVYGKAKLVFERAEWDLEARAEALEFVMRYPVPEGGFTDYESEMEYARWIHDFIACKVTYDPIGYEPEKIKGIDRYENKQEAYTALGEDQNSTVCAGYARAFALIAQYAGINCAWVWGNETETESHAWNVIYPCDGSEPVLVDVTWDDTASVDTVGQTEVGYEWFYIPLSQVTDHTPDAEMVVILNMLNDYQLPMPESATN